MSDQLSFTAPMRRMVYCLLLLLPSVLHSQDIDSTTRNDFNQKVVAMVDSMQLTDPAKVRFYEIYHQYGQRMKEAYENRTSWAGLNHTYQWSIRDRDSQMAEILTDEQLWYFKRRQREIEREARQSRANSQDTQ